MNELGRLLSAIGSFLLIVFILVLALRLIGWMSVP